MKISKRIGLGILLVAVLLIAIAFVPYIGTNPKRARRNRKKFWKKSITVLVK